MAPQLATLLANRRRAWRRGVNLRAPRPVAWWLAGVAVLVVAGGVLLALHAQRLGAAAAATEEGADAMRAARLLQPLLPGARFDVPSAPGVTMLAQAGGAVLVASRLRAEPAVRIDLCTQLRDAGGRLLPLRLGYRFDDVQGWAKAAGDRLAVRNVLLVSPRSPVTAKMPEVRLTGTAAEPLQLAWSGHMARWLGDADGAIVRGADATGMLRGEGWLAWEGGALQLVRRASTACPRAGELVARLYAPDAGASGRARVTAYAMHGAAATTWLAAGHYAIPATRAPELEDETLFLALQQHGLIRLTPAGAIELAPADLPDWLAAPASARAVGLESWRHVRMGDAERKLLRRLYRQADGSYLRHQVAVHNSELQLLAWRVRAGDTAQWRAEGTETNAMPPLAARLFAVLPQGWQPWNRMERLSGDTTRLALDLPRNGERQSLLLAGRVLDSEGAAITSRPACDGHACMNMNDVQLLQLQPQPGGRRIVLTVAPLDARAMERPGDRDYRHLRVVAGRIVWQPLGRALPGETRAVRGPVTLADRNGTPLWADDASTAAADQAGLATLLGVGADHTGSVAGMLARAGSQGGAARLSLDLPLQALAQQVLDCVAMRRGHWNGKCVDGAPPAAGRKAGLVVLDAENGDILAAAGAGNGHVDAGNWAEARDSDRASPAGSPLRLPALQHDGGAHNSPGSTFKVISALGLEMAAASDAKLDALLGGLPLGGINALARERGFDFTTGAPTYPASARGAYVTNYREMGIDGRVQQGRLGIAQALTYSLNTWFAWTGELSDRTLFGRAEGGAPDVQALEAGALDAARPILAAARRLGFEQPLRLDGGLLPAGFAWREYDALLATPARIDPVRTRHELRQMSIGLRMQATPLQMALAAAAVGQGATVAPRLLLEWNGHAADDAAPHKLDVRLDRIRAGMKGVVDRGTAAGAFRSLPPGVRAGLYGKTGTAPVTEHDATVWFTGWLEPGSLPGQTRRLAVAAYVSHSEGTGGDHAAPAVAALLATLADQQRDQSRKQKGK